MAENYLFFAKNGDNDADKDANMIPRSRYIGAVSLTNSILKFLFKDRAIDAANDDVQAVITVNAHKTVCDKFAELANGNRNNTNNFTVIKDTNDGLPSNEGAISATGISEIAGITITTS